MRTRSGRDAFRCAEVEGGVGISRVSVTYRVSVSHRVSVSYVWKPRERFSKRSITQVFELKNHRKTPSASTHQSNASLLPQLRMISSSLNSQQQQQRTPPPPNRSADELFNGQLST